MKEIESFFYRKVSEYEGKIKAVFDFNENFLGTFVKDVKELSDNFLRKKVEPVYFYDEKFLRAYTFFYFSQNYFKTVYLLSLLKPAFEERKKVVALDFGGGPGNSTLAIRDFLFNLGIDYKIYYIDKQSSVSDFFESIKDDEKIIIKDNFEIEEKIDIFLFSYTLKEIGRGYRRIISKIIPRASDDSFIIFLDAPDPEVLSFIDGIRKLSYKNGFFSIFPCPIKGSCPVVKLKKDKEKTCFTQLEWEPTDLVSTINSKLFFRIKYLKFSSIILSNRWERENYVFSISPYLKEKGKGRVYFCTDGGRVEAVLMKKNLSESNELFREILRGSMVRIEGEFEKSNKILKLGKETKISFCDTPLKKKRS